MQERNNGIELYRCFLMWGICLLHSISQGIYNFAWAQNALLFCVDGFVFITGYYGTSFKWSKIVKLYGVALYTGTLVVGFAYYQGLFDNTSLDSVAKFIKSIYLDAWFLNGYVVVLCFAPIIEKLLSIKDRIKTLLPFICLVFGWAFLRSSPYIGGLISASDGIGEYSGITLLGVYICGRIVRSCEGQFFIHNRILVLVGLLSFFACMLGFGNYASPFAVIVSFCLFAYFKNRLLTPRIENILQFIGPSLFSVYLLHSNGIGFTIIKKIESSCQTGGGILGCVICSFIIFVGCLILDIPRRVIVRFARNKISGFLFWTDYSWNKVENFVETILNRGDV